MKQQFRQGDVFVERADRPADPGVLVPLDRGRVILAYGEVTGHAHQVVPDVRHDAEIPAAQLFAAPDGARFLFVERPCTLVHEEHGPIALAPGSYRVTIQREYHPEEIRNVAD